jgi:hypothetical protein
MLPSWLIVSRLFKHYLHRQNAAKPSKLFQRGTLR